MAHELYFNDEKASMAFIGDTPWHGFGQELTPNSPLEVWITEAGMDYLIRRYDLFGALWLFCNRYHSGQWSRGYRILSRLSLVGYSG